MREIKFRAWDSEKEEMAKVIRIGEEDMTLQDGEGGLWDSVTGYTAYPMQYTGFKDKNDVEIYEGDIVRVYNPEYDNEPNLNKVEFVKDTYRFVAHDLYCVAIPMSRYYSTQVEVVGNIYEKPELLDQ